MLNEFPPRRRRVLATKPPSTSAKLVLQPLLVTPCCLALAACLAMFSLNYDAFKT